MRRRLGVFIAAAALASAAAVGTGSTAAMAFPPPANGFYFAGWYGTLADCQAAGQAGIPSHGPVYFCLPYGAGYNLYVH